MILLVATRNPGKAREYAQLLHDLDLEIVTLDQVGITDDVAETGTTFAENALLKARAYAACSSLLTLADDSGLEVDALSGAPGVFSARYGGPGLDDRGRYELLLRALRDVPDADRSARFHCTIALASPDGREATVDGACEGRITRAPRGQHGFGYDPVFWVDSESCTMAELPTERKNQISHRAAAARGAIIILRKWLSE